MGDVYLITGPTGIGKTSAAIILAPELAAEIVSADSRQVYAGMDIGTAKPTEAERKAVRHYLIDVADPSEDFNVALFMELALEAIERIKAGSRQAMVVGGTGLYLRALLEGLTFQGVGRDDDVRSAIESEIKTKGIDSVYEELKSIDPEACEKIHPNNIPRVVRALEVIRLTGRPFSEIKGTERGAEGPAHKYRTLCLTMDRDALYRRIDKRVEEMVMAGWPDEVRGLLEAGYSRDLRAMNAIGYKEMTAYVEGRSSLKEAIDEIRKATRNFAQRQLTFFRGMPELEWVEIDPLMGPADVADILVQRLGIGDEERLE